MFKLLSGGYLHGITSMTYGVDIEKIRWLGILQVLWFAVYINQYDVMKLLSLTTNIAFLVDLFECYISSKHDTNPLVICFFFLVQKKKEDITNHAFFIMAVHSDCLIQESHYSYIFRNREWCKNIQSRSFLLCPLRRILMRSYFVQCRG